MSQTRPVPSPARLPEDAAPPDVSVVVTVFDEERSVEELYRRTVAALDGLGRPYELIFVDDGSRDGTFARIERLHERDGRVRAVRFKRNFGQHPAMHAGLARARGDVVVTMGGDLQNAPEDIPRLVAAVEAGSDGASGRRGGRRGPGGGAVAPRAVNRELGPVTRRGSSDLGC